MSNGLPTLEKQRFHLLGLISGVECSKEDLVHGTVFEALVYTTNSNDFDLREVLIEMYKLSLFEEKQVIAKLYGHEVLINFSMGDMNQVVSEIELKILQDLARKAATEKKSLKKRRWRR